MNLLTTTQDDYYFKRTGVRILCICPGGTLTRFLEDFPKKMIYPDEEAALRFFNDFPKQTYVAHCNSRWFL